MLRTYFVCVEYDATTHGALPAERYPGLAPIRHMWDVNPWTRVGFGAQWVLMPDGGVLLSSGARKPFRAGDQGAQFQRVLEESLRRFLAIRSHPRGSDAEARALTDLGRRIETEWRTVHRREVDPWLRTCDVLEAGSHLEERFPGVLHQPEPEVRIQVARLLRRYALEKGGEGFLPGGPWEVFSAGLRDCLDDPEPPVREAAARALLAFRGAPEPTPGGPRPGEPGSRTEVLVEAARAEWSSDPGAQGAPEPPGVPPGTGALQRAGSAADASLR